MTDPDRERSDGLPIAFDRLAESRTEGTPGFLAPPAGAPAYHGFVILDDVEVEGFRFGKISEFEGVETDWGDAFVVAPDDSRAGLVWQLADHPYIEEILAPDDRRWGVWYVGFPHPMENRAGARANLGAVLPLLKPIWERWKADFPGAGQ